MTPPCSKIKRVPVFAYTNTEDRFKQGETGKNEGGSMKEKLLFIPPAAFILAFLSTLILPCVLFLVDKTSPAQSCGAAFAITPV
jgi:amino acid permease